MDHLRRELHQAKAELEQKEAEVNNVRTQWRRAVSELNRLKARGKSVNQATDKEILDKVEQLRYEIRNFAFQHFESHLSEERIQASFESIQNRLHISTHRLRGYLTSPSQRSLMIRSYIWSVLVENIAGMFFWCGDRHSEAMQRIRGLLYPENHSSSPSNEELQKWNHWRVETTRLICDAENGKIKAMNITRSKSFTELVDMLYRPLRHLTRTPERSLWEHLSAIVRQFLDLDLTLNMQIAEYIWDTPSRGKSNPFAESTMVLEHGEQLQMPHQTIALVLAPGLVKYGTSEGGDYYQSLQVLKMEVSCQIIRGVRRVRRELPKERWFRKIW